MEYLLSALERANYLYIGITQFERSQLREVPGAGAHRNHASSNPLTYFERSQLILLALDQAGVAATRYAVGPFPIEKPAMLTEFLPTEIPILSTRVDEWNDKKVALLQIEGYKVDYLFERDPKGIGGAEIRDLMARGDERWKELVPEATIEYIVSVDLPGRLRELGQ